MRSKRIRVFVVCAGALLVAGGPAAAAKPKAISGKLSSRGYTVIALASDGKAKSVRVKGLRFKLRPPGKRVTLHLRARNGRYAGPIVIRSLKKGKVVVVGVKAGAKLGRVKVGRGYARLAKRPARKSIDAKRVARAKKGIPIGARRFGLVRSRKARGPAADRDLDGIPAQLDVDDDGDLVLDDYDRSSQARASQFGPFPDGSRLHITTNLGAESEAASVNVNGGSNDAQIAASQQTSGRLNLLWSGIDPGSGEIDCGKLVYCSAGGTGRFTPLAGPGFSRANAAPFPACCDADGDGLGSLIQGGPGAIGTPGGGAMSIYHGATPGQIHAGDVLVQRATVNGTAQESASSVGFVYSTFPVVAAYNDGQGNASTFSYPRPAGPPQSRVRAGPTGDIVLRLTLWRPQRPRIASEPGQGKWMDVGNLSYVIYAEGGNCPQGSFSGGDPNLTPVPSSPIPALSPQAGGFADVRGDQPSSPANTLSFTFNLTRCLAARGRTLGPNQGTSLGVTAVAVGRDAQRFFASSWFSVRRQP